MEVHLDTTIQIDRIFGSRKRWQAINSILSGNQSFSSTYVLGQFYSNVIKDFIMMYHIIAQSDDIYEAERRCNENAFFRSQTRVHKIFIDLRQTSEDNLEYMKLMLKDYCNMLIERFYFDINFPLLDNTRCHKALAKISYNEEGDPELTNIECRKNEDHCSICDFWKNNQQNIGDLEECDSEVSSLKNLLANILLNHYDVKGINCIKLSDAVIALEAKGLSDNTVCSSNKKHFDPLCKLLGVNLIYPDYRSSFKNI